MQHTRIHTRLPAHTQHVHMHTHAHLSPPIPTGCITDECQEGSPPPPPPHSEQVSLQRGGLRCHSQRALPCQPAQVQGHHEQRCHIRTGQAGGTIGSVYDVKPLQWCLSGTEDSSENFIEIPLSFPPPLPPPPCPLGCSVGVCCQPWLH